MIAIIAAMPLVVGILARLVIAGIIDRLEDERRVMVRFGLLAAVSAAAVPVLWLCGVLKL